MPAKQRTASILASSSRTKRRKFCSNSGRILTEMLERRAYLTSPIVSLPGFSTSTLPANDDGSSPAINLGFSINFFGQTFSQIYVNNNGNVTFGSSLSAYTPSDLTSTGDQIIAPFWADVDTRGSASGVVTYGGDTYDGHTAFGVEWPHVGYYDAQTDKLNTFELILIDRSDTGAGNFDIQFDYGSIQWETGQASGGTDGLGGSSARVGFTNGTRDPGTYYELPGSAINGAFLDSNTSTGLINNSFNSGGVLGRYVFNARNGIVTAGSTPLAALDAQDFTGGVSTYQFTVFYSAADAIDATSLSSHNLVVTTPDGFSQDAQFISATPTGNTTPITATYQISAPASQTLSQDLYTVTMEPSQVKDIAGHFVTSTVLGTFGTGSTTVVTPAAVLSAPSTFIAGTKTYQFNVTYHDAAGILDRSIGNGDIQVTGPNSFSQLARLVSVDTPGNAVTTTATYELVMTKNFSAADAANYTFNLRANQVTNIHKVALGALSLGTVALSPYGGLLSPALGEVVGTAASAMAVDSAGRQDIAFFNTVSNTLQFISRGANGGFGPLQTIDASTGIAGTVAIAVRGTSPVVAYYDSTAQTLKYAQIVNGVWKVTVADATVGAGVNPSITFDSQGRPAISYYNTASTTLKLARLIGHSFVTSTVDATPGTGLFSSIALDPKTHELGIAYTNQNAGVLDLATQTATAFTTAPISGSSITSSRISLAFTTAGLATVAESVSGSVNIWQLQAGTWVLLDTFTLSSTSATAQGLSLTLAPRVSSPVVTYADSASNALEIGYYGAHGVATTSIFSSAGPIVASAARTNGEIEALTQPTGAGYSLLLLSPAIAAAAQHTTPPPTTASTTTVNVPGTSNPWLAGEPAGTTAYSGDVAPAESPAQATDLTIAGGSVYTFSTTGTVNYGAGDPGNSPPDGESNTVIPHAAGTENGFSSITAPADALLGVFLSAAEPSTTATPAPALDFSTAAEQNFTALSPLLNQPFFIGDGLNSSGTVQQFIAPAGATRLFLGIQDGYGWSNNSGAYTVTAKLITTPSTITYSGLSVAANAEIFAAGSAGLPDSSGVYPVPVNLASNVQSISILSATGSITLDSGAGTNDPDGAITGSYSLSESNASTTTDFGGISGITAPGAGYLVGVFVSAAGAGTTAPADLNFVTNGTNFSTLSPLLNQTFFIGDGKTGDGTGATQKFVVPAGAVRLYLGISDAGGYDGSPGAYGDNSGNFTVSVQTSST